MRESGPATLHCPKCPGSMRTFQRNGVQVEQCDSCRGIFLDFGELEALIRLEGGPAQGQYPPPYPQQAPYPQDYHPGWAGRGHHDEHYRRRGFGRLFFSS